MSYEIKEIGPALKVYFPHLVIIGFSFVVLLFELIIKEEIMKKTSMIFITLSALFLVLVSGFLYIGHVETRYIFSRLIVSDRISLFFMSLFVITGILCYIISLVEKEMNKYNIGEFFFLLLSTIYGLTLMCDANNLLVLLIGIELVSLTSYALSGYFFNSKRSTESALKYSLFGASTSGIALFGLTLISVSCGSFYYTDLGLVKDQTIAAIGWALFLGILFYKISAVPFHMWTPDIYEGAPLAISAFLSTAPKAAGFVVFIRILNSIKLNNELLMVFFGIITIISALSMTFGNLLALQQTNYKRLLAYSTIAHSGYVLLGIASFAQALIQKEGVVFSRDSVLFYILIYIVMNLGAFLYLGYFANYFGESIKNLEGTSKIFILKAVFVAIFLLSLTGLPPTGGFIAKLNIFSSAIQLKGLLWLVIIALINTVISVGYYFKIFRFMFLSEKVIDKNQIQYDKSLALTVNSVGYLLVTILLLTCIYPQFFYNLVSIDIF